MRTPLVAGNWKMHKTEDEAVQLIAAMIPGLGLLEGVEKLLCPPFTVLSRAHKLLASTNIRLGAQNMYWQPDGAYTGEVSGQMLAEFCHYVILGHSERRSIFSETDVAINLKVKAALHHGLVPLLCVGETRGENESGKTAEVISHQLCHGLAGAEVSSGENLVVAYEPVWAIGSGRNAIPGEINRVVRNVIRPTLAGLFGEVVARQARVVYGGSVTSENAGSFFCQEEIDGALVGGASLKVSSFVQIVAAAV